MNRNLAFSLLALTNLDKIEILLKLLKNKNIYHVELPITKIFPTYVINKKGRFFLKLLKKYSIRVSSLQSIFHKVRVNIFEKKDHKKIIMHIKKVIIIAKFLKTRRIIYGSPITRFKNKNLSKENADKITLPLFRNIAQICSKNGIIFGLEPNSKFYNCNYIVNLSEAIDIIKKINSPSFLLNFDTGNIFLEDKKRIKYKINQKYICNYQISEIGLKSISSGNFNHRLLLKNFNLKDKFISLEMKNISFYKLEKDINFFIKILKP
jgi:sugar phosphate isomerase/epimerase